MRRAPSSVLGLLASAASLLACTQDTAIRTETLALAAGEFYAVEWGGTQLERFYAVARPNTLDTHEAVLISPEQDEPCSLGNDVAGYSLLQPQTQNKYVIGSPSPTRILLFGAVQEDDSQTVSFADIHCRRLDFKVSSTAHFTGRWNLYSPDFIELKLLFLTDDGVLTLADPWAEEQRAIARNVAGHGDVRTSETVLWVLDGGEVVRFDHEGNELSRRGSGITEFTRLGDQDDFMYTNDKGTFTVRRGKTVQVGPKGSCRPQSIDSFKPGAVSFFAPCDSRRLVVVHEASGKQYEYESAVSQTIVQQAALYFTTVTGQKTSLWLVRSGDPAKSIRLKELNPFSVDGLYTISPELIAVLASSRDRARSVWAIDTTDPAAPLTVLKDGVVSTYPFDGGQYVRFESGDITLYDSNFSKELFRVWSPPEAPHPPDMVFGGKASALAYLSEFDLERKLGRLELQLINGTHFTLDRDVREFKQVWWPERGLVYSQGGDKPSLRFARVDIPCETTSDTAWACGF